MIDLTSIPKEMKQANRWLVWDYYPGEPSPFMPLDIPQKMKKRPVGEYAFSFGEAADKHEIMRRELSEEHIQAIMQEHREVLNGLRHDRARMIIDDALSIRASARINSAVVANRMMPFDLAVERMQKYGFEGLGFALGGGWSGLDFDNCLLENGRATSRSMAKILEPLRNTHAWVEQSPSGQGLKVFLRESFDQEAVKLIDRLGSATFPSPNILTRRYQSTGAIRYLRDMKAFEYFIAGGWFTVTGKSWGNNPKWNGSAFDDASAQILDCINTALDISQSHCLPVGLELLA